jgi:hypothetical protein
MPWALRACAHMAAVCAITLIALPPPAGTPAQAQSQRPTITVAPTLTVEAAGQSPLAIRVGPAGSLPRNSFLRIRGLPPLAALSEGHSIAPGSWAVPLAGIADLKIALPADAAGRSDIVIMLVALDGAILAEGKSTLVVAESKPPLTGATMLRAGAEELPKEQRGAITGQGLTVARPMTPEDRERASRLLQKGDEQLAEGNVSSARLLFEKAADAGLAQAAMSLAATYDKAELARIGVRGIQPDDKLAKQWYERALQLGAREAEQRLQRLGAK